MRWTKDNGDREFCLDLVDTPILTNRGIHEIQIKVLQLLGFLRSRIHEMHQRPSFLLGFQILRKAVLEVSYPL